MRRSCRSGARSTALAAGFELIGEACDELRDAGSQAVLRIAVTPELAHKWLVSCLADFSDRYPQITLHLHEQPLEASLPSPDIDLVITYGTGAEGASAYFVRPFNASVVALGQYALVCERIRLEKPAVADFLDWLSDHLAE